MTFLLTNDDGIEAEGLRRLALAFEGEERVHIVAPRHNGSGVGHAISLHQTVGVETLAPRAGEASRVAVAGTPADTVKYALQHYLLHPPTLVLSGINNGPNIGMNVHYSGTVAAALEAVMLGVPALALSLDNHEVRHWDTGVHYAREAVRIARDLLVEERRHALPNRPFCLNVNIPDRPLDDVRGVRVTRHGASGFRETYHPAEEEGPDRYRIHGDMQFLDPDDGYDGPALQAGFVTITPLRIEMTDPAVRRRLLRRCADADAPVLRATDPAPDS